VLISRGKATIPYFGVVVVVVIVIVLLFFLCLFFSSFFLLSPLLLIYSRPDTLAQFKEAAKGHQGPKVEDMTDEEKEAFLKSIHATDPTPNEVPLNGTNDQKGPVCLKLVSLVFFLY
jgi:hypothetical protein